MWTPMLYMPPMDTNYFKGQTTAPRERKYTHDTTSKMPDRLGERGVA